ncbi:MAG: BadF/BadG/BcrA/BcrD ATPase family protein [Candidatus Limiplasma sp.]|nr:BadF/BadG/BcrA/BcrD ATPase family protein [Candidatus Limiplasma sp.]
MKGFVMGLDGGSSKSHLALFDISGTRIDFVSWGPLNHEVMDGGFEQLERELHELIRLALDRNGLRLEDLRRGVFGMSGVDTKKQQSKIHGIYQRLSIADPLVVNDAFLPIKAVSPTGYGIGAINGSGCTVAGLGLEGRMLQIGGCGGLTGDLGGGSQLGETVARTVYESIFKGGAPTMLSPMLRERLGVQRDEDFLDMLVERLDSGDVTLSDLNQMLFEAANQRDEVALRLLRETGEDSARAIGGLLQRLPFPKDGPVDVALAGSVYVKGSNPALVNALKDKATLLAKGRALRFTVTDRPPVMGAIVWALEGFLPAGEAIARVGPQL